MTLTVILASSAALLVLAAFGVALHREPAGRIVVYGGSLAISAVVLVAALAHLLGAGPSETTTLPVGLPWLHARFQLDALAAFFLAVVNLGAALGSLYALGYGKHEQSPQRVLPFYPLFLAGMTLVVVADDAFSFLFTWEFMSLSSWALVMAHDEVPENRRAGYIYLVMASFGTLCLLLAFGLLAGPDGQYAFSAMRESTPSPGTSALVLILVLIGTGSKAGLVPLHVWLPLAHPAAPSHVSALLSGVMTKVAVYGFIRIVFDLLGTPEWWWSMVVLALAGITCVMGVLYALMQHDLKRLLAYHTVENIGIIFIGLGLALAFQAHGMPVPAALAFTAALLHVFNHSLFKSLLFFGSGAVLAATHERDMEHLGGLIHPMPLTAFAFLIGCVAISALAAAERLRLRMADLPGDPAQPATAILGAQIPRARGRCALGALCGARSGVFRQGLRRHLPRPSTHRGRSARARSGSLLARRHVHPRRALPACRHSPRLFHRRTWSRCQGDGRRQHAGAA